MSMNVYRVGYQGTESVVEASSLANAVEAWKSHLREELQDDLDGTEESESVALLHDEPVIQGK